MAKVKAKKNGAVNGHIKFDKDSRKGTFHRYQIVDTEIDGKAIVGTIYIPNGMANKCKKIVLEAV